MTIKELIEVSPSCDLVEITIRKNGHGTWIQGYRIGKNARIFPSELTKEIRERYQLEAYERQVVALNKGDEVDLMICRDLPMKVICKDVSKIPDQIANLRVCHVQPRHIPSFHRNALTHNDFAYDIDCFPDGYVEVIEKQKETDMQLEGQVTIEELLEEMG